MTIDGSVDQRLSEAKVHESHQAKRLVNSAISGRIRHPRIAEKRRVESLVEEGAAQTVSKRIASHRSYDRRLTIPNSEHL